MRRRPALGGLQEGSLVLDAFQALGDNARVAELVLQHVRGCPVCLIFIATVEGEFAVSRLNKEFKRIIKFFVQFRLPSRKERIALWELFLPKPPLLMPGTDVQALGRDFEFSGSTICSALVRASCRAALRPRDESVLTQKDIREACVAERWGGFTLSWISAYCEHYIVMVCACVCARVVLWVWWRVC